MNLFEDLEERQEIEPHERLARKALDAYGLGSARLELVSSKDHVLFRVTDGAGTAVERFALRIHPSGWSGEQILQTLSWLAAIRREARLPVPEPVLTRSGELIQSLSTRGVSGFHQVTFTTWVPGKRSTEWTPERAAVLGRRIAELHAHSGTYTPSCGISVPRRDADAVAESIDAPRLARAVDPAAEAQIAETVSRVEASMSVLGTGPEVCGMIHGNLIDDHVLFEEDAVGLIGFTRCRWGYHLYDVATIGLDLRLLEEGEALVDSFLEGYTEVRPLPDAFETHLNAFRALRLLDRLRSIPARSASDEEPSNARAARRTLEHLRALSGES